MTNQNMDARGDERQSSRAKIESDKPPAADQTPIADDLLQGMPAIAAFYGMPVRKAYHLAAHGNLPGTFKIGKIIYLSKSAAREIIAQKARGGAA
ncbi:hypothetical protein Bind_3163 [Beijerinckia indica subsp. indica ATCC 9039]|uniref:Helix-turn-helix domain-containing protein n=2 Tax=Beijerinckia TaxID=532 RepID=B2ICC7_BEII9|nr:hypothetical protein Bind_3163 [Beijerinckia indica subsp. indica ATCC 9039]